MNHKTKLLEIYKHSYTINDITDVDKNIIEQVKKLGEKISSQKGVSKIQELIDKTKDDHGCQIIINGVLPTINYYLRLIDNTEEFLKRYSALIEKDRELKIIHKKKWNKIIQEQFNKK